MVVKWGNIHASLYIFGDNMKIIPLLENKIKIVFENGEAIEVYELPNGNGIKISEEKELRKLMGNFYKIVPAGGGERWPS